MDPVGDKISSPVDPFSQGEPRVSLAQDAGGRARGLQGGVILGLEQGEILLVLAGCKNIARLRWHAIQPNQLGKILSFNSTSNSKQLQGSAHQVHVR